jgi:hypothetical protein
VAGEPPPLPPAWAGSIVGQFIDAARANEMAVAARWPRVWRLLNAVAELWDSWRLHTGDPEQIVSLLLRAQAKGAYLGAVRLAAGGQPAEAQVLVRTVLEHSVYGWWMVQCPADAEVWLRRGEGEAAHTKARQRFKWAPLMNALAQQVPDIASAVGELYRTAIDHGAHPNADGVLAASVVPSGPNEGTQERGQLLVQGDTDQQRFALQSAMRAGVLGTQVFGVTWPADFQALGLRDRANRLWRVVRGEDASWL